MRCRTCDYPLWGLKSRQCPDCGTGFMPSDFDFVPGAVRFCCPECGQSYYGTSSRGHLEPFAFACSRCNTKINMDTMVLHPAEGVHEDKASHSRRIPWLRRTDLGFLNAYWKTLGMSLGNPITLGKRLSQRSEPTQAVRFCVITLLFTLSLAVAPWVIFLMAASNVPSAAFQGFSVAFFFSLVGYTGIIGLWILIGHAAMRLWDVFSTTRSGNIGRTTELVLYGSGPQVLLVVPCLSFFMWPLVGIWWAISTGLIAGSTAGVGAARATMLALIGPAIVAAGFGGFIGWGAFQSAQQNAHSHTHLQPTTQQVTASGTQSARLLLADLNMWAQLSNDWPEHPLQLPSTRSNPTLFTFDSNSNPHQAAFTTEGMTHEEWIRLSEPAREALLIKSIELVAKDSVYRVQDVIVTWNGLPDRNRVQLSGTGMARAAEDASDSLWLFLLSPAPSVRAQDPSIIWAGTLGAGVLEIDWLQLDNEIDKQNRLRADLANLPPLPHPDAVLSRP